MPSQNDDVKSHQERVVCGIAVDMYSIMIPDKYDPAAIPGAWSKFWSEFPKADLPNNSEAYSVVIPIDGTSGKLHYIAGVEVPANYVAPAGFELVTVPAGNYLELAHLGNISTIAQSYGEAYGVAYPQSGLAMREAPHLERYDSTLDPNTDDYKFGILIPVA